MGDDERIGEFLQRPLTGEWPYVWLDAACLKVRQCRPHRPVRSHNRRCGQSLRRQHERSIETLGLAASKDAQIVKPLEHTSGCRSPLARQGPTHPSTIVTNRSSLGRLLLASRR